MKKIIIWVFLVMGMGKLLKGMDLEYVDLEDPKDITYVIQHPTEVIKMPKKEFRALQQQISQDFVGFDNAINTREPLSPVVNKWKTSDNITCFLGINKKPTLFYSEETFCLVYGLSLQKTDERIELKRGRGLNKWSTTMLITLVGAESAVFGLYAAGYFH